MHGLVGFIQEGSTEYALSSLQKMAEALNIGSETVIDTVSFNNIHIGLTNYQGMGEEIQPIWNEDNTICIMLVGELYDYQDLKRQLINRGHVIKTNIDAEFALHLYEEIGIKFVHELNGSFIVTIIDTLRQKLLVCNDRFGLHPLYYSIGNGSLFFATGLRGILSISSFDFTVDLLGLSQLITFDYLLDDRTLINEIKLLPPASILSFSDDSIRIRTYWNLEYQESYPSLKEDDIIEGFTICVKQAIERQVAHDDHASGVLLSGGLDSRLVAALLASNAKSHLSSNHPLYSFTFGIPQCDDARNAAKVAKTLKTEHRFYELRPDYLIDIARQGVALTDGLFNIVHMHAFANIEKQANLVKIIYKGYMGDALLGGHLSLSHWSALEKDSFARAEFKKTNDLFSTRELDQLLTPMVLNKTKAELYESFRNTLFESCSTLPANLQNQFDLRQRQRRFILNGVELARSKAIIRTPFCDKDLVEFAMNLPPGMRYNRRLVVNTLIKNFPQLAQIPVTQTGLPLMNCTNDLYIRTIQLIRWHLHSLGLLKQPQRPRRPYADYDIWFRSTLREWVKGILLSKHSLDKGFFNPDYIRKLTNEHFAGKNHARKLGILITFELWHNQIFDQLINTET